MAGSVNLKSKISLDDSAFVSGIKRVQRTVGEFAGKASQAFRSVGGSIAKAVTRLKNFAAIIAKISLVGIGAGIAAAGVAVSKLVKAGSGMAAQYETIRLTMGAYLKDLGQADTILNQIAKFSVVTPFETTGLQDATNTLLGAGIAGEEVVDVLKEIAAVSKTTGQVGELADALSKGFAKGKFQTEELNKFLERGINLMPELERVTGKSGEALQKAIQKGLKFEDVRTAIASLSEEGGLFFGMLETQSKTFSGLISTLSSNWDEFLLKFGQPINDSLKPLLDILIEQVQKLTKSGAQIGTIISTAIDGVVNKIKGVDFVGIGQKFLAGLNMEKAKELLLGAMKIVGAFLGNKLVEVLRFAAHLGEVAFTHVFEKLTGDFGQRLKEKLIEVAKIAILPPPLQIAKLAKDLKKGLKTAGEDGMTLEEKLLAAKDALKDKVQKDPDPFGFNSAVDDFKDNLDQVMQDGAAQVEQLDQESEPDAAPKPEPTKPLDLESPAQPEPDIKPLSSKLRTEIAERAADIKPLSSKLRAEIAAPEPLRTALQTSKSAAAIPLGKGGLRSQFSQARGLQTGGLGAKRYTNPAREAARIAKEQKKDAREQIEVLRDVDRKLEKGLVAQ